MIAEVLPHLRLARSLGFFDYLVPNDLCEHVAPGVFVVVPWRGRNAPGIIWATKETSDIDARKLRSLRSLLDIPALTPENLALLEWFAHTYGVSLAHALKTFIPSLPLRTASFTPTRVLRLQQSRIHPSRVQTIHASLKKVFANQNVAVRFPDQDFMNAWYYGFVRMADAQEQTLIVVPEIRDIDVLRSRLGKAAQHRIAVFHSEQSKNESLQERRRVADGGASIIVGTKCSVFLPFFRLRTIVIHDEGNDTHRRSDQNPRFDAREVARQLAKLYTARRVVCGSSLSLFSELGVQKGEIIDASPAHSPSPFRSVELNTQELESPIGHLLQESIKRHLEQGQKIFLFLDKRGLASSLQCRDCKYLFTCAECGLLLHAVKKKGKRLLTCLRAQRELPLPLACPQCGGPHLSLRGWGTERIEQDIQQSFSSFRIQRIDSFSQEVPLLGTHIFIGTEYALKRLPWSDIGMVGIIHVHGLLQLPSYESLERVWRILEEIRFYTKKDAECIIQKITPLPPFLITGNRDEFTRSESSNRKKFFYPPFAHLLVWRKRYHLLADSRKRDAQSFHAQLKKRFPEAIFISEPQWKETAKEARANIFMKLPVEAPLDFSWAPDPWIVDVDPPSLLR